MPHFATPQGVLHFLSNEDILQGGLTLLPEDAFEISEEEAAAMRAPAPLTTEELVKVYEKALDDHMDAVARSHRYNDRFTFALRAGYPGPFHDEGIAFAQWMDALNADAYALLAAVQAGTAELPSVEEFIAGFDEFVKP